jgi:Icc-related predicted phosphoesterase
MTENPKEKATPEGRRERPQLRRAIVHAVAVAALGGLVAMLGVRIVPAVSGTFGPGALAAQVRIGGGATFLAIPPLGSVSADTHFSPLNVAIELTRIDPVELGNELLSVNGRDILAQDVEGELRSLALHLAIRLLVASILLGALVAALLPGRRLAYLAYGAGSGLAVMIASIALTITTFDVEAFAQPRFTGVLTRAPAIIKAIDAHQDAFANLQSRYRFTADRIADLLALTTKPNPKPAGDEVKILHVSDIHSNPLGVEIARQLATSFDVDAVVDTGDITSFGRPIESHIGRMLKSFPAAYYIVPGNHDSPANRRALDRYRNVTMIDERIVDIDGVRVLGWPDPAFTATNEISTEQDNRLNLQRAPLVAAKVEVTHPDVLAVHNRLIARDSFGRVSLVLSGHIHEQDIRTVDGTLSLTLGSTGATGLGSFTVEATRDYEASILYFRNGAITSMDYVRFKGVGANYQIEHYDFSGPGATEVPSVSPSP